MTTTTVDAASLLAATEARRRAQRRATSLPLTGTAAGLAVLAVSLWSDPWRFWPGMLVPSLVYLVLWVVAARRTRRGPAWVTEGKDRYGVVLLVLVLLAYFSGPMMLRFAGPAFALGIGLLLLDGRTGNPLLRGPGIALVVTSPIVALVLYRAQGPLLLVLAVGCGALALVASRREAALLSERA
ncbi:hypothetical protein ASE27_07780 [Oerskovia sp. Root918]|uniref:hypothetical protein n=1 Tax=Oerskovia sp. Root918 TaxID=1736607 RepID=UPI0006F35C53|nr:hypothetical protein [Oerskovia sp. Root918]KRD37295.1 hypothetical protein ASE27_07780 [Oerskovia sp. Root918]